MGVICLILGESGSGKSTSMRNFSENEIGLLNVASKPLPFRKKFTYTKNKSDDGKRLSYNTITATLKKNGLKRYVIDDSQYLLAFEAFDEASTKGYDKFTKMAVNFYNLLQVAIESTSPDTICYFLHHIETTEFGKIKAKTIGKMLDQQLTIEGLFSIVLLCKMENGAHRFITQSDGISPAKSPVDMFASLSIDNDLKMVDDTIRNYWGLAH